MKKKKKKESLKWQNKNKKKLKTANKQKKWPEEYMMTVFILKINVYTIKPVLTDQW